jgi:hypothetical protein
VILISCLIITSYGIYFADQVSIKCKNCSFNLKLERLMTLIGGRWCFAAGIQAMWIGAVAG